MRFRTRLILITSLAVLAVGLAAATVLQYSLNRFNRLLYDQTAYALDIVASSIASEMEQLDTFSRNLATSKEFQDNLYQYNTLPMGFEHTTAHKYIRTIFYRSFDTPMLRMAVYCQNGNILEWGLDSSEESPEVLRQARELCDEANGASVWIPTGRPDGSILLCRKVLQVEDFSLDELGYLLIRIDLGKIIPQATATHTLFDYDFSVSIFDAQRQPVYSTLPTLPQWLVPLAELSGKAPYTITKAEENPTFLVQSHLPDFTHGWVVALGIPYSQISSSVMLSNTICLLVILLTIVLLIVIASLATKSLSERFNLLITKMERLKCGNFELLPTPATRSSDELTMLNRYFDEMTVDFKHTIEDNYIKELLIAQAQLKSLEQQINPHFLYNTLQSVSCLARNSGERDIIMMVESLANLLRSSLDSSADVITIEQELSVVQSYVQIQQIRFGDTLSVDTQANPALLSAQIPKMTIQPLVENAIVYAMEEMVEVCEVHITVSQVKDNILITVENNGSQIDENILEQLRTHTVTPKGNGIGLYNIDARIKLIFGEGYGLSFRNLPDGVLALVTIPFVKEIKECSK